MQISINFTLKLCLVVTVCFARPARKSSKRSDQTDATDATNYDPSHREYSNNGDNEGENNYEYDDRGGGVYAKMDQIVYPFQQYVQVRRSYR